MPSLPVPFLLPEELLTQSTWNTVSPEVQISAKVGGKRNLRLPVLPLPFPTTLLLLPMAGDTFHTSLKLWPLWRALWPASHSSGEAGFQSPQVPGKLGLLGSQGEADSVAGTVLLSLGSLLSSDSQSPSPVTKVSDCVTGEPPGQVAQQH